MSEFEAALRYVFDKLSHDELVNLAVTIMTDRIKTKKNVVAYRPYGDKPWASGQQRLAREITYPEANEAKDVLDKVIEKNKADGFVTIGEVYKLSGIFPEVDDFAWGWRDVSDAYIISVRHGMKLVMPTPIKL